MDTGRFHWKKAAGNSRLLQYRQGFIPVEGNAVWAPLCVYNISAGFEPSNCPRNVTSRRDVTHARKTQGKHKISVLASKESKPDAESRKIPIV